MHEELLQQFKDLQNKIPTWKKQHGIFVADIKRIEASAEKMYDEYQNIMIKHRQSRKQHYADKGAEVLQQAIKTLNKVSKIELLTSLSKG
jgi:hypothetical protein